MNEEDEDDFVKLLKKVYDLNFVLKMRRFERWHQCIRDMCRHYGHFHVRGAHNRLEAFIKKSLCREGPFRSYDQKLQS